MIKSHKILAVLGVLMIGSAPAVASLPPASLQVGGAVMIGSHEYVANEGSIVTLSFRASPGDAMWVFAAAHDKFGNPDYSNLLTLLFDKSDDDGILHASFQIPHGLADQSFTIVGLGMGVDGLLNADQVVMRIRSEPPPADVLEALAIPDGG